MVETNPNLRIIIDKFDSGPPVFAAVEYRILGDDPKILQALGEQLELISSNCSPNACKIFGSSPNIRYSTAAKTGGPESNLSIMILRLGFVSTIDLANAGRPFII